MGSVVGTAANGVGTFLGNAFAAPFRALFGASCEGVCAGTWDVACFVEHLCVSSLARLFMVLVLIYITVFFVYLMFKVGIIQCVVKSTCKMAAAACSASWHALGAASCFLWRKLRNTKRVHRGRRRRRLQDVERGGGGGFSSSSYEESSSIGDGRDRDRSEGEGFGSSSYEESSSFGDDRDRDRSEGEGFSSSSYEESSSSFGDDRDRDRSEGGSIRTRRSSRRGSSVRQRRKDKLRRSLRLRRLTLKKEHATIRRHGSGRHHRRVGLGRFEVSSSSLRDHGYATARRGRMRGHCADEQG